MRSTLLTLIVVTLALPSLATDYAPRTVAEMAQDTDVIVVGVATTEKGKTVIRVSEVLKGERTKSAVLNRAVAGPFREVVITSGDEGVFFLNKHGAGHEPILPSCYRGR